MALDTEALAKRKAERKAKAERRKARRREELAAKGRVDLTDETVCTKCGICCYLPMRGEGGKWFYTPFRCTYFDADSKLCTIYDKRLKVVAPCNDVVRGIRNRVMPDGCPYHAGLPKYKGPNPDYTQSKLVKAKVEAILANGPDENGHYTLKNTKFSYDEDWTPATCVYSS